MARHLTPMRVVLLLLIDIYISDEAPSSARLNLLDFIARHIDVDVGAWTDSSIDATEYAHTDALALLEPLTQWPSAVPGRSMLDMCLQRLWQIGDLNAIHLLFEKMNVIVTTPVQHSQSISRGVTRVSPLGQFIRRCHVEFMRLQFADLQALSSVFARYRRPTYDLWAQRNPDAASQSNELNELPRTQGWDQEHQVMANADLTGAFVSANDVDRLLTASTHHLQKFGTRIPKDLQSRLRAWLTYQRDSSTQSLQHFLAFFDYWRAGQYTMALESLHRYFDYSLIAKSSSDNMKTYYQYAQLHLSVLHADFDCWGESFDAMAECIATARENQDTVCLNFALSWMLYLQQTHPTAVRTAFQKLSSLGEGASNTQDAIAFLKAKSKDSKQWSLYSSTLLEEAKMEMSMGSGMDKAQECIMQSIYTNVQHDLRTLMPATISFYAASLDRLGQAHLTIRLHEGLKLVHQDSCPLNDYVRIVCRLAYSMARTGQYSKALQMLCASTEKVQGILMLERRLQGFAILINFQRTLNSGHYDNAKKYLSQLRHVASSGDPDIKFEVDLAGIDLLIQTSKYDAAFTLVNEHLEQRKDNEGQDIAQRLQLLVQKGRVFAAAGRATKAFSIVIRAASVAQRLRLTSILMEALAILARALIELSEFAASRDLVEAALPTALETRHLRGTAQLYMTLGEAYVGLAGVSHSTKDTSACHRNMRIGSTYIDRSREVYTALHNLPGMQSCFAMEARIAQFFGDEASAAHADAMYLQLSMSDSGPDDDG